jgi:tRNA(fMet)-specific endonuclease VapC
MHHLDVMPLEPAVGRHYASLRAGLEHMGKSLSPNDLLIAAHAVTLDAILVSGDVVFGQVPGLTRENWLTEPV